MGRNLEAVEALDHRRALIELLYTLAEQLDTTQGAIHAQLASQYNQTWDRLVALDAANEVPEEVSDLERIRRRRAARDGAAADHSRAAGDR